ncbi:alkaline phosphatase family protein [Herbidospora sp. NBRC 101105]|uniref:alkaline phosphatase family protein n=1 Tax=Herbidospora sp. NBRC 101105 TaxID=3032195 RepID=UPI002557AA8B|nr:alkaline phosphatase family protein [Herbidospora sp. NBRC 101105]
MSYRRIRRACHGRAPAVRVSLALAIVVALGCGPVSHVEPPPPKPVPKVLVIGVDGVRTDRVLTTGATYLRALMSEGLYATGQLDLAPGVKSLSGPAWSTILTGVNPEKHGVRDNTFAGRQYTRYPDFLTRLERLRPDLDTLAVTLWRTFFDTGLLHQVDWHATLRPGVDYAEHLKDEMIIRRMTDLIARHRVDVVFLHLVNPDKVAHKHGPLGPEYVAALDTMDLGIGRLVDAVRRRPTYRNEKWSVIVVTDHGHRDEGGHGGLSPEELQIFLLAAGPGIRHERRHEAKLVDVAPTVFAQLGMRIPADFEGVPLGGELPGK